jgi:hypothetical protein
MSPSREEEAGLLYLEGAKAVRAGGHELTMLAGHLALMINGTRDYPGPLWPVRVVQPDRREIKLDRFIDYLLKPAREGLGLPSLHFLRQVLKASKDGDQVLELARAELAKEHVDLDATANKEHETELLKRQPGPHGHPTAAASQSTNLVLSKGGTDRQAAQLAARRSDLAQAVRDGRLKLSAALIEAGIRKKPKRRCPSCGHEWRG